MNVVEKTREKKERKQKEQESYLDKNQRGNSQLEHTTREELLFGSHSLYPTDFLQTCSELAFEIFSTIQSY